MALLPERSPAYSAISKANDMTTPTPRACTFILSRNVLDMMSQKLIELSWQTHRIALSKFEIALLTATPKLMFGSFYVCFSPLLLHMRSNRHIDKARSVVIGRDKGRRRLVLCDVSRTRMHITDNGFGHRSLPCGSTSRSCCHECFLVFRLMKDWSTTVLFGLRMVLLAPKGDTRHKTTAADPRHRRGSAPAA